MFNFQELLKLPDESEFKSEPDNADDEEKDIELSEEEGIPKMIPLPAKRKRIPADDVQNPAAATTINEDNR